MTEKAYLIEGARNLIARLPVRRAQAANWIMKLSPLQKPFIGTLFGNKIEVHPMEAASRSAYFLGFYERETTIWCMDYMKKYNPQTIFDVGANFGYFSYLAKAFSKNAKVTSFEPDPYNFDWLQRNLSLLDDKNFKAEKIAISNRRGIVKFVPSSPEDNKNLWSQINLDNSAAENEIEVPSLSLDEYCDEKKISIVNLLKMDIEGAEGLAVDGMASGIKNKLYKAVLIELHPHILKKGSYSPDSIAEKFLSSGYKGFQFKSTFNSSTINDTVSGFYDLTWDNSFLEDYSFNNPNLSEWEHVLFTAN
ncbi:MAG: FkbM family methyltransferase [Bdellovibrionaceae bacterium]|nr:FkbM family methyltransferase [Pseudobdellovibrionaceae bacterium]